MLFTLAGAGEFEDFVDLCLDRKQRVLNCV